MSTGPASSGVASRQSAAVVLALDAGLFLRQLIDPAAIATELRAEAIADVIDRW